MAYFVVFVAASAAPKSCVKLASAFACDLLLEAVVSSAQQYFDYAAAVELSGECVVAEKVVVASANDIAKAPSPLFVERDCKVQADRVGHCLDLLFRIGVNDVEIEWTGLWDLARCDGDDNEYVPWARSL